jgi:hypothetical protein
MQSSSDTNMLRNYFKKVILYTFTFDLHKAIYFYSLQKFLSYISILIEQCEHYQYTSVSLQKNHAIMTMAI